jgi:hypothetical protein
MDVEKGGPTATGATAWRSVESVRWCRLGDRLLVAWSDLGVAADTAEMADRAPPRSSPGKDGLIRPMLATSGPVPVGPGWAFEVKFDGVLN